MKILKLIALIRIGLDFINPMKLVSVKTLAYKI